MLTTHLAAIVSAALGAGPSTTPDASMLRYPDIGPRDIAFVFAGNIWLVPKEGGTARPLTSTPGAKSMPRFSPDGSKIAFTSYRDGNYEIYVMNADGTGQTRMTHNVGSDFTPSWGETSSVGTTGSISGVNWNDVDGDGAQDGGEPTQAGWTIYLDTDRDGQWDAGEPSQITDAARQVPTHRERV